MQDAKIKLQNGVSPKRPDPPQPRINIPERLLNFATQIIKIVLRLRKSQAGRHIGRQLTAAGTSAGANYEEACGAESRADFIHKLQVVLKEPKESVFWLRLIEKSQLLPKDDPSLSYLMRKGQEPCKIIGKSVVTAKRQDFSF